MCHVITRILLIWITKIEKEDRQFLNTRSFLSCILPATYFQNQTLGYFKILYLKNISEVNSVAFPGSFTLNWINTILQKSMSLQHCKAGMGSGMSLLPPFDWYCITYILFFFTSFFFFFKFGFNVFFFSFSSFCPRIKLSLDSQNWGKTKKAKQTLLFPFECYSGTRG